MPDFTKIFEYISENEYPFITRLAEAVAIPSVSGESERREDVVKMGTWLSEQLTKAGATDVELKPLGKEDNGLDLPPVVVGRWGTDEKKKTVLIYGHYDVQPAQRSDGWWSKPFKLAIDGDRLIGRGSTDDKGPVCGWLNVLDAHREAGVEIPVNLVFCFEGMEESGSIGLDDLIKREADGYFKGVDAVCISDNYWLGTKYPVVTYGVRGVSYYEVAVEGPKADLHSGLFGGIVYEPLTDLVHVFSQLVTPQGEILIPGLQDMVAPLTDKEDKLYDTLHFDLSELEENVGAKTVLQDSIKKAMQARWREPSLSLHGIEGAFAETGAKTVIPHKVIGKFSIRTVPNIEPRKLDEIVFDHVKKSFAKLNSKNKMEVSLVHDGDYWVTDPHGWSYTAAVKATKEVYGVEPDLTREGGSIPITLSFQNNLNAPVVLLPMGRGDDGAHSTNEKLNLTNFIKGSQTLAAYLHYLAE
ncbi:metallodipeptidase [Starmerella bacillaris]|uniref:Metallodipeptidase n=1 Tax=Starmerella bacillaris TaxID=1247836 RepID=A0AAV5RDM0_STABA|nr:metallodipeptidase [Starmerella bacillaris]